MPGEPRSSVMIEPPLVTDVVAVAVPPVLLPAVRIGIRVGRSVDTGRVLAVGLDATAC